MGRKKRKGSKKKVFFFKKKIKLLFIFIIFCEVMWREVKKDGRKSNTETKEGALISQIMDQRKSFCSILLLGIHDCEFSFSFLFFSNCVRSLVFYFFDVFLI